MPEPNTTNVALIVPNTGDLVGAWGTAALNTNFTAIDGLFGGVATIALASATTIALSLPSGSITPGAGPVQSQNALIKLTGTLTGNCVLTLGMPGRYMFHNQCTVGSFYVQITSSGLGNACGLPPGQKVTLFHDGVNIDYVDSVPVGAALDLHGVTSTPAWMTACTVRPYLLKDGTTYNVSSYPALGALLGSTFGGNGATTFGVPDERGRMRVAYDGGGTGRMTSPVNAGVMGSNGGEQAHTLITGEMPSHTHAASVTDTGHTHNMNVASSQTTNSETTGVLAHGGFYGTPANETNPNMIASGTTGISITNALQGGSNAHNNVQPSIVSFLAFIKT
jgi:microcystin-dependent protein